MIFFAVLLCIGINVAATKDPWKPVVPTQVEMFDLETTPLEIKTNTEPGNAAGSMIVTFKTANDEESGKVYISYYRTPITYKIDHCSTAGEGSFGDLPEAVGEDNERVWRFTLTRTSGLTLLLHCNDEEMLTFDFETQCGDDVVDDDKALWDKQPVAKIQFSGSDVISEEFRAYTPVSVACQEGSYKSGDMAECQACPAGKEANEDKTDCAACHEGSYKADGMTTCQTCAAGKAPNKDKTECEEEYSGATPFSVSTAAAAAFIAALLL